MLQIFIALVCLCFQFSVFSEEDQIEKFSRNLENQEENSYLIDLQGMPSSIISGCVNAITGNYSEAHLDLHVNGSNPLPLIRSYNSSKQDKGTLCAGWDINLPGEATVMVGKNEKQALVNHGGSFYNFEGAVHYEKSHLNKNTYKYGVTNAHHGQLTAREKLENTVFTYKPDHKHSQLVLSDNEMLEFDAVGPRTEQVVEFELKKHFFPNRCRYEYQYKDGKIAKVKSVGLKDQFIGSLEFEHLKKKHELKVHTNDGRSVQYLYSKIGNEKYFLSEVNASHLPQYRYEYWYAKKSDQVRLIKKSLPDSRYLNIEYYSINGKKDSSFGRVSQLKAPVGTDTTAIETYNFIYNLDKDKASSKPIGGSTEVLDAYGNKTVYCFSKEHRLEEVQSYLNGGNYIAEKK